MSRNISGLSITWPDGNRLFADVKVLKPLKYIPNIDYTKCIPYMLSKHTRLHDTINIVKTFSTNLNIWIFILCPVLLTGWLLCVGSSAGRCEHYGLVSLALAWAQSAGSRGRKVRTIMTSWHGNAFRLTGALSGESTDGFPSQRVINADSEIS